MTAPTLPRRAILKGLGALPAATMAIAPAANASALASPDAALIDAARRACILAALDKRATDRQCDALLRFEAVEPVHPGSAQDKISAAMNSITDACPTPRTEAGNALMAAYMRVAQRAGRLARERHEARVAAYEAECERLRRESGLARAERLADYLSARLARAVEALAATPSATPAGTAAKARVLLTIDEGGWQDGITPWIEALTRSVVREAATLGGSA